MINQNVIGSKEKSYLDDEGKGTEEANDAHNTILIPEKFERNDRFVLLLLCHVNVCEGYHPNSIALTNKQTNVYIYRNVIFMNVHRNGNVIYPCNRKKTCTTKKK